MPGFHGGELRILRWGNRHGKSAKLPNTLWTLQATIDAGDWLETGAEEVVTPAALGIDNGIWFAVTKGVRGLLVPDEVVARRIGRTTEAVRLKRQKLGIPNPVDWRRRKA